MNQTALNVQDFSGLQEVTQHYLKPCMATSEHRNLPHSKLSDGILCHVQLNYVNDFSSVRESDVAMGSDNTDLDRLDPVTRSAEPNDTS
jgi:hypothetical protein